MATSGSGGGGGGAVTYGREINVGTIAANATLFLQRATDSGFTTNLTEVGSATVSNTVLVDTLPNNGTTYYWRAYQTAPGFTQSAYSATISGVPVLLDDYVP